MQVCSRCGTRWNVRDQRRVWCPRCNGALLAPSAVQVPVRPADQGSRGRLPAGFRWIAVRPGPPPPPRRIRRPLGPTPRYQTVPRWGLRDQIAPPEAAGDARTAKPPSPTTVRAGLLAASAVFAGAAAAYALRYVLLLINRTTLLPPWLAAPAFVMGGLATLAAFVAVAAIAVVMTSWLIGRRAEAYQLYGQDDPRPRWALWAGCLTPVVNLAWAPVLVLELAHVEGVVDRVRRPVVLWWITWVFATGLAAWATWTSGAGEPQGVADNTVTEVLTYLAGFATLLLLWRVFDGFEGKPLQQPRHRWVVVEEVPAEPEAAVAEFPEEAEGEAEDEAAGEPGAESPEQSVVESRDREPAA